MTRLKTLLLSITLAITFNVLSQNNTSPAKADTADYPYWIEMMQDESVNFYDVQRAFNIYWKDREITKGSGWKPFKRWEWWMENHINPDGTRKPADKVYNEYMKYIKQHPGALKSEADWTSLGPFNIPGGDKGYKGLGRINAIAFHPTNPDIVYIGAPAGGMWKYDASLDTWTSETDVLPVLGVSAIVVDWNNPDNIFIGSGDRDAGDSQGMGVFKSSDGGQTWELWNNGMGNVKVGRMIQHPTDFNTMFAATTGGVFKTTDGGANWSQKISGTFKDIVFKPGDPDIIYAVKGGSLYKSVNAGEDWEELSNGIAGGDRAAIAVTEANPNVIYLIQTLNSSFKGLYKSTNEGASFTEQSTTPNIMSWGCDGGEGGQAWYDLDIACDPDDQNVIYTGGVNCWKSEDGGVSWNISSHWYGGCNVPSVHADLHVLEWNPLNHRLYAGNDGGIYYTPDDGNSWPEITSGLAISQVYKIGQCASDVDKVINGYQDNGTSTYYGNDNWMFTHGGDGMECAFDFMEPEYSYATVYFGAIVRKYNNGNSYDVGGNGVHGIDEDGGWITPFCLHETNTNIMFAGYKSIWRTEGVKTNTFTWKKLTDGGSNNINVVEQSPANTDVFYYSWKQHLYRTDNVMDDEPVWYDLSSNIPGNDHIRDIEANAFDENIVYVTKGSKVYKSVDKGINWEDITGTLPDINMNSIAFYVNAPEGLYVGSDAGVYYRDATMDDWIMFSSGLPVDASVNEIEIYHNPEDATQDVIRAGTYGRGLWSSHVWQGTLSADFEAEETNIPAGCAIDFSDLSTGVPTSWQWTFEGASPSSSNEKNPQGIFYPDAGTYNVTLVVTNSESSDTKVKSGYITVSSDLLPEVHFYVDDTITCINKAVQFYDMSLNCPNHWDWSFEPNTVTFTNGTSHYSSDPAVVFNETGTYSVTVEVKNILGTTTVTKENYILVGGMQIPFFDDFESGSLSEKSWKIDNPDSKITWEVTDVGGNTPGNKAVYMNLYDYIEPGGPRDRLITPALSFEGLDQVYLSLKYAYAQRFTIASDSLIILISDDCGDNWTRLYANGEEGDVGNFATHELIEDPFVPAVAGDWCGAGWGADCITLDLSQWAGENNIKIAFESYDRFNNNLYLDNILIGPLTDIAENSDGEESLRIFPNPTDGVINILTGNHSGNTKVRIFNMQGIKVFETVPLKEDDSLIGIDLKKFGKGLYIIEITNNNRLKVEKVVVR